MDQFAEVVLAALLSLMKPGETALSRVPISICDEQCQQSLLCENKHHWRCKPPQLDKNLYGQYLANFQANGMDEETAMHEAGIRSFTRPETYEEGLVRYAIIAQAISNVSDKMTRQHCFTRCANNINKLQCDEKIECDSKEQEEQACFKQCAKDSPWRWKQAELAYMLVTAANQESGYRGDVHGGTGLLGKGDCDWRYPNGKLASAFAKGAMPVSGTCRSVCLGQINIGQGTTTSGLSAEQLVGVDLASTERCVSEMAFHMSRARVLCTKWNTLKGKDWPKATFSAYGSGLACTLSRKKRVTIDGQKTTHYAYHVKNDEGKLSIVWGAVPPDNAISKHPLEEAWPIKRSQIFQKYYSTYKKQSLFINPKTKQLLQEPNIQTLLEKLMTAKSPIYYMIPLEIKSK